MKILDFFFPADLYCHSCGRPFPKKPESGIALCENCIEEIAWIRDETYACVFYSGRAAELVREMKFRGKPWLAETVSALMAARYFAEADPETGELPYFDYLVSVPMNAGKKVYRGYDQAELIAEGLSSRIGIPYLKEALVRIRDTDVMSALSADERKINLAGAFSVPYDMIEMMAGKKLLLVDDVYTTGSTADACTQVLLAAGAESVALIVFAKGASARRAEGCPAVVESPGQLRAKGPT